jgi:3-oxoacyl-[acyl-carrier protein] reductase
MDLKLDGKIAIVTGGSKGIGRSAAERLACEGCKVAIAAREPAALDEALRAILDVGGDAIALPTDVTKPDQVQALVDKVIDRFGAVHVLVNNAGGGTRPYRFEDITDEDWLMAWELNLMSAVRASRAVLPFMRAQKWGRIINISSAAGIQPEASYAHYSAAKGALNNFTKTLSRAAGRDGVMVNSITVGLVKTAAFEEDVMIRGGRERGISPEQAAIEFTRKLRPANVRGRPGEPDEVAALIAFLASELSAYITGANYRIDGGATMGV